MQDIKRVTIIDNEAYLRQISKEVDFTDKSYLEDIEKLKTYCENNHVFAMAAVQIGIPKRIIYIKNSTPDFNKNDKDANYDEGKVLINPIIINSKGHTKYLEACESCITKDDKFLAGDVIRPYEIEVEYYDIEGNKTSKKFEGFESIVFSHEFDHLNGILHIDISQNIIELTLSEMREYRTNNPYQIIDKDKEYSKKLDEELKSLVIKQ